VAMYGFCYDMVVPKNSSFLRAYCPVVDFRIVLFVGLFCFLCMRSYVFPAAVQRAVAVFVHVFDFLFFIFV